MGMNFGWGARMCGFCFNIGAKEIREEFRSVIRFFGNIFFCFKLQIGRDLVAGR